MTTRRLRMLCTTLAPWLAAASLLAAPIGRPTPPPCAVDGACKPTGAWGYSGTRWRTWPGVSTEDGQAAEPGAAGADLIGPTSKPDPRSEDKLAPPKVEALDPQRDEARSDDSDFELPEMPEGEGGEEADDDEGPGRFEPPRPGFMDRAPFEDPTEAPAGDAQPGLPFGQPPATPFQPTNPPADLFPLNGRPATTPQHVRSDDAPPALPQQWQPRRQPPRTAGPQLVLPTTATLTNQPGRNVASAISAVPTPTRVQRAAAMEHFGDAPPHMPQGLFGSP